jgi:hypothetical protein
MTTKKDHSRQISLTLALRTLNQLQLHALKLNRLLYTIDGEPDADGIPYGVAFANHDTQHGPPKCERCELWHVAEFDCSGVLWDLSGVKLEWPAGHDRTLCDCLECENWRHAERSHE